MLFESVENEGGGKNGLKIRKIGGNYQKRGLKVSIYLCVLPLVYYDFFYGSVLAGAWLGTQTPPSLAKT